MATYSNNTTIKIGSTIAYASSSWSYTVPSGSCFVLTFLRAQTGISGNCTVQIILPTVGSILSFDGSSSPNSYTYNNGNFELPAGTVISATPSGGAPGTGRMCGFLKTNTP